jgi:large subunit ribosomal protein L35Ae
MKGKVVQFRRGLKRIHERHFILDVNASSKEDAAKFAGKEVVWTSPAGKKIKGKISVSHGNKGLVRAIFEKGLPGQARNTEVAIDSTLESGKINKNVKSRG